MGRQLAFLATAVVLVGASPAAAQEDGVTYDPDSPAGKEYALPLDRARDEATGNDRRTSQKGGSELFGAGIKPASGAGSGSGSGASGATGTGTGGSVSGRGGTRTSRERDREASTGSRGATGPAVARPLIPTADGGERLLSGGLMAAIAAAVALGLGVGARARTRAD